MKQFLSKVCSPGSQYSQKIVLFGHKNKTKQKQTSNYKKNNIICFKL